MPRMVRVVYRTTRANRENITNKKGFFASFARLKAFHGRMSQLYPEGDVLFCPTTPFSACAGVSLLFSDEQ
jgi:hypothetical protein